MELEDKPAQSERAQNERQIQGHSVAEVGRDLGGSLVLPPAPAGPLKLPAAQLLEEVLSVKDFIRSLESEI